MNSATDPLFFFYFRPYPQKPPAHPSIFAKYPQQSVPQTYCIYFYPLNCTLRTTPFSIMMSWNTAGDSPTTTTSSVLQAVNLSFQYNLIKKKMLLSRAVKKLMWKFTTSRSSIFSSACTLAVIRTTPVSRSNEQKAFWAFFFPFFLLKKKKRKKKREENN